MSTGNDGQGSDTPDAHDLQEQLRVLQSRIATYEYAARRFEDLFYSLPVACYTYDGEGLIHDWNKSAENLWGFPGHEAAQRSIYETICPESERGFRQSMTAQVMQGKRLESIELRTCDAFGELRWTLTCELPQFNKDGEVVGGLSANLDITERKLSELALSANEDLFRTAINVLQNGVLIKGQDGLIECCNPRAGEILGADPETWIGGRVCNTVREIIHEDGTLFEDCDLPGVRAIENGEFCTDVVLGVPHGQTGETVWLNVKSSPIYQGGSDRPVGAVVSFSDITQRRAHVQMIEEHLAQINDLNVMMEVQQLELQDANERLESLANNDGLTGVANHRAFQDFFERQIDISQKTGRGLSIVMFDVDHFKKFNDEHGHRAGDQVLIEVAKVMQSAVRESDLVARYGGEEFVVVLPGAGREGACRVAEQIREHLESYQWQQRPLTVSGGIATLSEQSLTRDDLVEEADRAMYRSKESGRNRITHFDEMAAGPTDELAA
ncbi:MAG: diguanylate cyclase [Armatimonadetes bacterium]|nr:diguanylate cyclase [Armatimonadota bacterium]